MKFELKELPIDKVKPDKDQPRKTFQNDSIQELSESILSNGLIEPIEVDENYVIIDGERRWRAHKLANLKTINCKVFKLGNNMQQRRIMQLMNDIQKEEIPTAERYQALWELYELEYPVEAKKYLTVANRNSSQGIDCKLREFSKSIGKNAGYIVRAFDYLELAKEEPELVEGLAPSLVGETKKLPKEERKEILKEMKEGGVVKTIDQIREAVKQKKQFKDIDEATMKLKQVEDVQLRIRTTNEQLSTLRDNIDKELKNVNTLMFLVGKIGRRKLYVAKPKEKENFFKYIDGVIVKVERWVKDLRTIKDNLELEVINT